eukprot:1011605-Pleurochrysis_carterae.AAC.2
MLSVCADRRKLKRRSLAECARGMIGAWARGSKEVQGLASTQRGWTGQWSRVYKRGFDVCPGLAQRIDQHISSLYLHTQALSWDYHQNQNRLLCDGFEINGQRSIRKSES